MFPGCRIDYKQLRRINPEAARQAVLEYLKTNGGNVADAARIFGINRTVIYDILRKKREGDLGDRSHTLLEDFTPGVKGIHTPGVSIGIIQDTPIEQDVFSYAKAQHVLGNIDDAEWKLYLKIYHSFEPYFPKPDLIIYLETPVPILLDRIAQRGREYEQKIPQSYLELLDMLNHRWLSENKAIPVLTIETDSLNIVRIQKAQQHLLERVRQELRLRS